MNADKFLNVAGAIVVLAGVSVVVTRRNSQRVIGAIGRAFSGAIRAATLR